MNTDTIDPRSRRMLDLLAQGAGSKALAKELGYQEGTMRVYLHNLYRKIGVGNKTEAVIWWLKRTQPTGARVEASAPVPVVATDDIFGDMALSEGLYAALGVMGAFVGPYGRIWEVGQRLAGEEVDVDKRARQARGRALWSALLKGDFAYGKQVHDVDEGAVLLADSPTDSVMLVALLAAGGYSAASRHVAARVTDRRRARMSIAARESAAVRVMLEAFESKAQPLTKLHKIATERGSPAAARQLALVLMFHAARSRKDMDRAREAAGALWAEAEGARKELLAMGDRSLGARPVAAPVVAKSPAREKEKAALAR